MSRVIARRDRGKYLTPAQFGARAGGASEDTVRRWCNAGRVVGARQVGTGKKKHWRIPEGAAVRAEPSGGLAVASEYAEGGVG